MGRKGDPPFGPPLGEKLPTRRGLGGGKRRQSARAPRGPMVAPAFGVGSGGRAILFPKKSGHLWDLVDPPGSKNLGGPGVFPEGENPWGARGFSPFFGVWGWFAGWKSSSIRRAF